MHRPTTTKGRNRCSGLAEPKSTPAERDRAARSGASGAVGVRGNAALYQAALYLLESDGNGFELVGTLACVLSIGSMRQRGGPLLRLVSTRQPVTLEQLEREHDLLTGRAGAVADLESLDAIARTLVELQAGAVIGIGIRPATATLRRASTVSGAILRVSEETSFVPSEQLIGLLCIKDDRSHDAFASAELDVVSAIAAQLGITVQNSAALRANERARPTGGAWTDGGGSGPRNSQSTRRDKGAAEFIVCRLTVDFRRRG